MRLAWSNALIYDACMILSPDLINNSIRRWSTMVRQHQSEIHESTESKYYTCCEMAMRKKMNWQYYNANINALITFSIEKRIACSSSYKNAQLNEQIFHMEKISVKFWYTLTSYRDTHPLRDLRHFFRMLAAFITSGGLFVFVWKMLNQRIYFRCI